MRLLPDMLFGEPCNIETSGDRKRLHRFCEWYESNCNDGIPTRHSFFGYGNHVGSHVVLHDLEKTLRSVLPEQSVIHAEIRAARRDQSHWFHGRPTVIETLDGPHWKPFLPHSRMDCLCRPELFRLDSWLRWISERKIAQPRTEDLLEFAVEFKSEASLVALQKTFAKLNVPSIAFTAIELPRAIEIKRRQKSKKYRKPPSKKVPSKSCLPKEWEKTFRLLESGTSPMGLQTPSSGILPTMRESAKAFVKFCEDRETAAELTDESVIEFARQLKRAGHRANTREITLSTLKRFMRHLPDVQVDAALINSCIADARRDMEAEVPRINKRLEKVGTIETSLGKATDLLLQARTEKSLELRHSKLCAAAAIALFSLIPLRSKDTNLRWGVDVKYVGQNYFLNIVTSKTGVPLPVQLCSFLTPFLDALLLQGCDPAYLKLARDQAEASQRFVFCHVCGKRPSRYRVANIWQRRLGIGPHIARARIHTELGKLGSKGVEMALAACAQKDPSVAKYYQGRAAQDAKLLLARSSYLQGIPEAEIRSVFGEPLT